MQNTVTKAATSFWPIVFPLALAQFVCSYAATTTMCPSAASPPIWVQTCTLFKSRSPFSP